MKKILVVDDEPNIREFMVDFLKEEGHSITSACNGQEGMDLFLSNTFDVIISDVRMPVMSGVRFLNRVRTLNPCVPQFIIMTAHTDLTREEAKILGADNYFEKPFSIEEMIKVIEGFVPRKEMTRDKSRKLIEIDIELNHKGSIKTVKSTNISKTGMFFDIDEAAVKPGDIFNFVILSKLHEKTVEISGKAVCVWERTKKIEDLSPGVGVSFLEIDKSEITELLK